MLAGEGAAELQHQVRYLLRDGFELPDSLFRFEIDDRAHVQAAYRGMGIDPRRGVVVVDDVEEAGYEIAQLFRRDGGVLDERYRLGVAFHGRGKAQGRFAQAPDSGLRRQVRLRAVGVAEMA